MSNYREDRPGAGRSKFDETTRPAPQGRSRQEQSGPYQRTHEELVVAFRAHIRAQQKRWAHLNISSENLLSTDLFQQYHKTPLPPDDTRKFFEPLYYAWTILTHDRQQSEADKHHSNEALAEAYGRAHIIRLNDTQVRTLDAMAEAVGIHRPRGQTEIRVPEKYSEAFPNQYVPLGIDPVKRGPSKA